jgi:mannan endo-1,4-beta-mannosidase
MFTKFLLLILIVLTSITVIFAQSPPGTSFVTVSPNGKFMIDNAQATFVGTNSLFLAQFADAFNRNDTFQRMRANNMTLLRLWAFNDGTFCPSSNLEAQNYFQCWSNTSSKIFVNETALALHLDTALAEAGSFGLRVILALTNNWNDYGGIPSYIQWRIAAADAGIAPQYNPPGSHDDFYGEPVLKMWFKSWVNTLVTRVNSVTGIAYKDDPTILAWELGNELACQGASIEYPCIVNGTSPLMRSWVTEMASFIKSNDPNHLVTIGDEGFYGLNETGGVVCVRDQWWCNGQSGDWLGLLSISSIDFATLHVYPDVFHMGEWSIEASEDETAIGWIQNHTLQAHALNKPIIMEEFGYSNGTTQHIKFETYLSAGLTSGLDGWAVWMLAALDDTYYHPPQFPKWWKDGDAGLQIYCLKEGDPSPPNDTDHDIATCPVLKMEAEKWASS